MHTKVFSNKVSRRETSLNIVHKFSDRFAGQLNLVEESFHLISSGEWSRRDFQSLNKQF